ALQSTSLTSQRLSMQRASQVEPAPGDAMMHTPVTERALKKQVESPTTPLGHGLANAPTPGVSTPEVTTLAPKPCRAYPSSPGGFSLPDDPECSQELREVLRGGEAHRRILDHGKDILQSSSGEAHADHNRPLSSISTSAGPTPSPDGRTSPNFAPAVAVGTRRNAPSKARTLQNSSEGFARDSKAFPTQVRKVFVGGIPQDMQQEDLLKLFSEIAPVKKAWVQRYRDATKVKSPTSHNHRGFGFVIFQEATAVDRFLGSEVSRFIPVRDGRKLEVKRAISSTDMPDDGLRRSEESSKGRGMHTAESAGMPVPGKNSQRCGACNGPQPAAWPDGCGGSVATSVAGQSFASIAQPMPGIMMPSPGMMVAQASPSPSPWPTMGGEHPQSMTPPPQVQPVMPAVAGVPVAAPGVRAPTGMVMPLPQHGPANFMSSQQGQPLQMQMAVSPVPGVPCHDGMSPPVQQPFYNAAWAPWGVPQTPMPVTAAAFAPQMSNMAWSTPNQQVQQTQ
ncbi:Hnrnpa0, partial [Symbiodinium sp. CCMP2456]